MKNFDTFLLVKKKNITINVQHTTRNCLTLDGEGEPQLRVNVFVNGILQEFTVDLGDTEEKIRSSFLGVQSVLIGMGYEVFDEEEKLGLTLWSAKLNEMMNKIAKDISGKSEHQITSGKEYALEPTS